MDDKVERGLLVSASAEAAVWVGAKAFLEEEGPEPDFPCSELYKYGGVCLL